MAKAVAAGGSNLLAAEATGHRSAFGDRSMTPTRLASITTVRIKALFLLLAC